MNDNLLEPLKYYESVGEKEHAENVKSHFAKLLGKSKVDADENRKTVKRHEELTEEIGNLSKEISKFKRLRTLLSLGIVLGIILIFVSISKFSEQIFGAILLMLAGGGIIAGAIYLLAKKVVPRIKNTDSIRSEKLAEDEKVLAEAWEQMAPLNALFTDYDTLRIIEKTIPDFSFDERFTKDQERLFIEKCDFCDLESDETSMVDTLSGKFAGNPFLFGRMLVHEMGECRYHGSLKITWIEVSYDSNGNIRETKKTQVLKASVTKPKPEYNYNTFLAYGCQATPDLSFNRTSVHSERLSEKALERKIKKGESKLHKQAEKAVKKGGSFQEMANSEFDVLFGANDRDNEVQFRVMYTPLAQRNTVALIKDKNHYGDDFDFHKDKRFNLIVSDHAQHWDMNMSASRYHSYSVDDSYNKFRSFNINFFKSLFFDFAPIMSVPVYAEEPSASLEGEVEHSANYTYYEHEVLVNAADASSFVHSETATDAILKTQTISKEEGIDKIAVTAYSYATCERIDYIPVKGGDGNYHNVPVPWIEYIPLNRTTHVAIGEAKEGEDILRHGMNVYSI